MKAYILNSVNNLTYCDVDKPAIKDNEVLVSVRAAGVCSSDIPRVYTNGTYRFPTVIGHEFAGVVHSVGKAVDTKWIGKRVGVFPLIPCKKCKNCIEGKYEMCDNYNYLGSRCDGGFAEYVAVPEWNLLALPERVTFVQAAMLEPSAVAYHAFNALKAQKGDIIGVWGSGAIAVLCAMLAKTEGFDVYVIGRNEKKRALIEKCGMINYDNASITSIYDLKINKIIEAVGSQDAINGCIEALSAGGTAVMMGNPYTDIYMPKNTYWRILRKQLTLTGTWNSFYEKDSDCDWKHVLDLMERGSFRPELAVTHCYKQNELLSALNLMKDKKQEYLKEMVIFNE